MCISKLGILSLTFVLLTGCNGCSHLFYHPSDQMYLEHPETLASFREEVFFYSADGKKLAGWFFKAQKGGHRGLIVQFHGNAQNMTSHFQGLYWVTQAGYDLLAFDYRGYGISEGTPSQEGLNQDALAAIQYAIHREPAQGGRKNIVLYGQSLGGAVLARAFDDVSAEDRKRIRALVIESSFYNYHKMAADVLSRSWLFYIFQPLGYILVSNAYSPEDVISKISPIPLLVIHGDNDSVVPFKFGEKIFELAKEPKTFIRVPGGKHINAMMLEDGLYRKKLLEFLDHAGP